MRGGSKAKDILGVIALAVIIMGVVGGLVSGVWLIIGLLSELLGGTPPTAAERMLVGCLMILAFSTSANLLFWGLWEDLKEERLADRKKYGG